MAEFINTIYLRHFTQKDLALRPFWATLDLLFGLLMRIG